MKRIINIILFFVAVSFGLQAQDIQVQRTTLANSSDFCQPVKLQYNVSYTKNPVTNFTITDDFGANCPQCLTAVRVTSVPNAIYGAPVLTATGFTYSLPTGAPFGGHSFTFEIEIDFVKSGDFSSCTICSAAPQVTNATPGTTVAISPTSQECFTKKAKNGWITSIGCPKIEGNFCFNYPIAFSSPVCSYYDLQGGSTHEFVAPPGAIITSVNPGANTTVSTHTPLGTNSIWFTVIPTGSRFDINTGYGISVDLQYPCTTFNPGDLVQVKIDRTHLGVIPTGGGFPFVISNGLSAPGTCPTTNLASGRQRIAGSTRADHLPDLETKAEIKINKIWNSGGNDSPGCSNKYEILLENHGTTILDSIDIVFDPIPAAIDLTNTCEQVDFYRINNGPWIAGNPPSWTNVTAIKWYERQLLPGVLCDTKIHPSRIAKNLCFDIDPSTAIGTNIRSCVNTSFGQRLDCAAPGCSNIAPPPTAPLPIVDCHDFNVIAPTSDPGIRKSVAFSSRYPGETQRYTLVVTNCGSGPLNTTLQDFFPQELENLTVISRSHSLNGAPFIAGDNGWAGTENWSGVGNNDLRIPINMPASCGASLNSVECCVRECNAVAFVIEGNVKDCLTARLVNNIASIQPEGLTASARFSIKNRNGLVITKLAKGDASTTYSNYSYVSPGGVIDYRIIIENKDPKPWYDPIIVDMLPALGDELLCSSTLRGSQFDVELTSTPVISGSNSLALAADYFTNTPSPGIGTAKDFCTTTPQITNPSMAVGNRGFRLEFQGAFNCGDVLIIDYQTRVRNGVNGNVSRNSVHVVQKDTPTGNYKTSPYDIAEVEIQDWELPCCQEMFTVSNAIVPGYITTNPDYDLAAVHFRLQTTTPIPIQKMRTSIVDFRYNQAYDDCKQCDNHWKGLGIMEMNWAPSPATVGGLSEQYGAPIPYNRERIFEAGTVTDFSGGIFFPTWISIPKSIQVPCCKGCVEVCVKFELTDVNCQTCEVVQCFKIDLPRQRVPRNQICSDIDADPSSLCPDCPASIDLSKPLNELPEIKN